MKIQSLSVWGVLLVGGMLLTGCHKDDPEPQLHRGEGQLSVVIGKVSDALSMTCRIFPLSENKDPLENSTETTDADWQIEEWLPAGPYAVASWGFDTQELEISGTENYENAKLMVKQVSEGSTLMPLAKPVYLAANGNVQVEEAEVTTLNLKPLDIRRIVRITVKAGTGFTNAKVEGNLTGIVSSVRISDRGVLEKEGKLALSWLPAGTPGEYIVHAGVLGIASSDISAQNVNILNVSFITGKGEKFSFEEDITKLLVESWNTNRDTLDVELTVHPSVPIHIYTGIHTRATIDKFDGTPVSIVAGSISGNYTEKWEGEATEGEIVLLPERYYPDDGSPIYLRGYYPAAPLAGNSEVHYELTGQEDIMITVEQNGSLGERFNATEKPLMYKHLLSQLNFTIELKGARDDYKVRSVQLKGLASKAIISLADGIIKSEGQNDPVVIYADPGTGGFPVVDGKVSLPGYVLVQPDATLLLDLVLAVDSDPANDLIFKDVPVRFEGGGSTGGNAYKVQISLNLPDNPVAPEAQPITIEAVEVPWVVGDGGSAII